MSGVAVVIAIPAFFCFRTKGNTWDCLLSDCVKNFLPVSHPLYSTLIGTLTISYGV